jgi:hypothetical protein
MTVAADGVIAANTRIPTATRRSTLTKPWPCSACASQAVLARAAVKTRNHLEFKLR